MDSRTLERDLQQQYPSVEVTFWEYELEGMKHLRVTFRSLNGVSKVESHTWFLSESGTIDEYQEKDVRRLALEYFTKNKSVSV